MAHMSNCILFDCDGTLVDSERLSNIGLVRKFEEYGIQLDADELVKEFRGWKFSKILEALQARFCVTLADDFIESYRTMVAALFKSELKQSLISNTRWRISLNAKPSCRTGLARKSSKRSIFAA